MTTAAILQILAGLGGIISIWMRDYFSAEKAAERKKEAADEEDQKLRQECFALDTAAISLRVDNILRDIPAGDPAGVGHPGDQEGRTGAK